MGNSIIEKLDQLTEEPSALETIGRELVVLALQNAIAERMGQKIKDPMVVRRVRIGEEVPPDLVGQPGIIIDEKKRAASNWDKSWLNLILWTRTWSENGADMTIPELGLLPAALSEVKLSTVLTEDELKIVQKYKERIA